LRRGFDTGDEPDEPDGLCGRPLSSSYKVPLACPMANPHGVPSPTTVKKSWPQWSGSLARIDISSEPPSTQRTKTRPGNRPTMGWFRHDSGQAPGERGPMG